MTGNVEFSIFYRFSSEINDSELGARDNFRMMFGHMTSRTKSHTPNFFRANRPRISASENSKPN